jgi:anaerobic selenocysteine-containing dehydrogenase
LASERAERDGHGRVPTYRPPTEAGSVRADGDQRSETSPQRYDMVAAAADWHVNSVFAGTELTRARTGKPVVAINPVDAERDGLVDGGPARIGNDRGTFTATIRIDRNVKRGVAVTTKGWWGMGVNNTVAERDSDMGRGAVYHDNQVTVWPLTGSGPSV